MLSSEDICAMCDLTEEEIDAIAHHEHVSVVIAAEMGECLIQNAEGRALIYKMLCEDVQHASHHGSGRHLVRFQAALEQFCRDYPDAITRP
ncbi:MAG: hypothetical protein WED00_14040 [Aquisalimonadaceae bacterium]